MRFKLGTQILCHLDERRPGAIAVIFNCNGFVFDTQAVFATNMEAYRWVQRYFNHVMIVGDDVPLAKPGHEK